MGCPPSRRSFARFACVPKSTCSSATVPDPKTKTPDARSNGPLSRSTEISESRDTPTAKYYPSSITV